MRRRRGLVVVVVGSLVRVAAALVGQTSLRVLIVRAACTVVLAYALTGARAWWKP